MMNLLKDVNNLSSKWENLSGNNNWEGLLDPLDADLRRYIIHYGQMAGACGDLFNTETRKCQAKEEEFFKMACLDKGNNLKYKVTKFFKAGFAAVKPAWFGYVAVSDGEDAMGRIDILIAWRGPATDSEWETIKQSELIPNEAFFGRGDAQVYQGFVSLYAGQLEDNPKENPNLAARDQVQEAVSKLVEEHKDKDISITVTGFSLGGALATINALDIIVNRYNKPKDNPDKSCMVTAYVFGSPPVGNDGLKQAVDKNSELHILRIANSADLVLGYLSENLDAAGYKHVGKLLQVDSSKSPCLKQRASEISLPSSLTFDEFIRIITKRERTSEGLFQLDERAISHYMEVYLHAVAGVQKDGFSLAVDHDFALVNKHLDLLKDDYRIPAYWWEGPRKKMFQQENGRWKVSFGFNWEKLSGEENWEGLLDPLNYDLRRYIIHYGQMVGACGDLFKSGMRVDNNGDLYVSVNGRIEKVTEADFLQKACLEKGNEYKYKVTKFIEAASIKVEPAWFGYVAVSDGEAAMGRLDILIAWRGTQTRSEWLNNLKGFPSRPNVDIFKNDKAYVHYGFSSIYTGVRQQAPDNFLASARDQVLQEVERLLNLEEHRAKEISITVTGFSLGAALATINAVDIVVNGYNKPKSNPNKSCMVTAFVFGGPHIGNRGFKEAIDANNSKLHILRITNSADVIPKLLEPGRVVSFLSKVTELFKNKKDLIEDFKYTHVGKELKVNCKDSPYLKDPIRGRSEDYSDPVDQFLYGERDGRGSDSSYEWLSPHNMDVYLHAVAGPRKDNLCLAVDHDIALVNKYLNRVKDNYEIPNKWWEGPNRQRMTQQEDGHWKVDNMYEIRAPLCPSSDV